MKAWSVINDCGIYFGSSFCTFVLYFFLFVLPSIPPSFLSSSFFLCFYAFFFFLLYFSPSLYILPFVLAYSFIPSFLLSSVILTFCLHVWHLSDGIIQSYLPLSFTQLLLPSVFTCLCISLISCFLFSFNIFFVSKCIVLVRECTVDVTPVHHTTPYTPPTP